MRKKHLLLLKGILIGWMLVIYIIFSRHPSLSLTDEDQKSRSINAQLDTLEQQLGEQSVFYRSLLKKLREIEEKTKDDAKAFEQVYETQPVLEEEETQGEKEIKIIEKIYIQEKPVLPILVIACNREPAIRRSLDLLLKYRPSQVRFPIIVSQDCGHKATRDAIMSYGDRATLIQQPDLSDIEVPPKEKKFRGYFLIARHYKWAFDQIFHKFNYEAVIVVEDDLDIASDFYEYFSASFPILKSDPTLWCVSAWNDNGKAGLVDVNNGSSLLYRTDFFPGLGWMVMKNVWEELGPKWPKSYWDDWMRAPEQRKNRACIRPELSRTRTFGKKGVSNGLFYEKHLKFIHLNTAYVPFTKQNLTYLSNIFYDSHFEKQVQDSQVVSVADVKSGTLPQGKTYRIIYHTKDAFRKTAKALGLMDDFKAGVPRTGYKGVVSFYFRDHRIFLSPNNNWKGYDLSWS